MRGIIHDAHMCEAKVWLQLQLRQLVPLPTAVLAVRTASAAVCEDRSTCPVLEPQQSSRGFDPPPEGGGEGWLIISTSVACWALLWCAHPGRRRVVV